MKLEIDEDEVYFSPEDPCLNVVFKLAYLDSDLPRDQIDRLAKDIINVWNKAQEDRFYLFTESEKCSILESLENDVEPWRFIEKQNNITGGVTPMLDGMIKELEESLK